MAKYEVEISGPIHGLFKVKIQTAGKEVSCCLSGDDFARMIIAKSDLSDDLEPSKRLIEAFSG